SLDAEAESDAVAGWNVAAWANASAEVDADITPAVTVAGGATITGLDSVTIIAEQQAVSTKSDARSQKISLGGSTTSASTNTQLLGADVTTQTGSQIRTKLLTVEANVPASPGFTTNSREHSNWNDDIVGANPTQTLTRVIDFNSTVVITAPSPVLEIDADGAVINQYGVTFSDDGLDDDIVDGTTLTIEDVLNTGILEGAATFSITAVPTDKNNDDVSQLKGNATITFQTGYSKVTIINQAPVHMKLSEMDLLNETAATNARITKSVGDHSQFSTTTNTDEGATEVYVSNALGIELTEIIDNTYGSTELVAADGNLTVSGTGQVESHELILRAAAIGADSNRFKTKGSTAYMSGRLVGSA
ncbi:MAG: hypothetical protein GY708_21145, partial [Actinomycetia bacterium]|nr:hypothetical protein [Actinomycetes bacterium]